jgi:biopolymer transport protein ExbD
MANIKEPETVKMDLTPMIDVTFLLLIFFIVTLKFKVLEGRLDASLPKDMGTAATPSEPIEKVNVILLVSDPGTLGPDEKNPNLKKYTGRKVRYEVGTQTFRSIDELQRYLAIQDKAETPVTLDPRKGIINEDVMIVLDVIIREKFEKVSFAGTFENE